MISKSKIALVKSLTVWLCFCCLTINPAPGQEVGVEDNHGDPSPVNEISPFRAEQGSFFFKNGADGSYFEAPHVKTDFQLYVTGIIVRAEVTQWFYNPTHEWLEGVYVFPLPETAAVDHLRMIVGSRVIEGQIKERNAAQKAYTQAKKAGKKASLVEQERPNIFTNSVANIGPGEELEIVIHFQLNANYSQGTFQLRCPMVVAPRYIPGSTNVEGEADLGRARNTTQVPDAQRITPPVLEPGQQSEQWVSLNIELDAGFPIEQITSLYHDIDQIRLHDSFYIITLADDSALPNRDFVLEWQQVAGHEPQAALFTQESADSIYTMLMVIPPNPELDYHRLPRECIYVIDTSGSMHGDSIQQAKESLRLALANMRPEDTFNIIQFNSSMELLFTESAEASATAIEEAKWYVDNLVAEGGTNMLPALQAALLNQEEDRGLRQVIFITDGSVGNESELFHEIKTKLRKSRLFTVGIGSAPNSHFMRKAAQFGRGTFTHIGSVAEVQEKMTELFSKLENPTLSQIEIIWNDSEVEFYPDPLLDLYLGEPLVVAAKLHRSAGEVMITGEREGEVITIDLALSTSQEKAGLHKLWARQKIAHLMDMYYERKQRDRIRQEITDVALRFHLVSKFTSLVAIEKNPTRPLGLQAHSKAIPVPLPQGWATGPAYGSLPQTASPMMLYLIIGLTFLMAAKVVRICFQKG